MTHNLTDKFATLRYAYWKVWGHLLNENNLSFYISYAQSMLILANSTRPELLNEDARVVAVGDMIALIDTLEEPQKRPQTRIIQMIRDPTDEQEHRRVCHLVAKVIVGHENESAKTIIKTLKLK